MARPKYRITSDDVIHATQYLSTRLLTFTVKFDDSVSPRTAQKEFEQAVDVQSKEDRANKLHAWCEKFLGDLEWGKLKTSIRKRRERKTSKLVSISISEKAYGFVKKLAIRDKVTLSEAIEKYLGRAWRK